MIAIVDYDSGRPQGLKDSLASLGAAAEIVRSVADILRAHKIVLPPADSFARMIYSVRDRDWVGALFSAIDDGRPVLGVCRGLHLLFDVSYEDGQHTGLGIVPGKVTSFQAARAAGAAVGPGEDTSTHRGWSEVHWTAPHPLFEGIAPGTSFYFDHRYYAEPLDAAAIAAYSRFGIQFSAAIARGVITATQFLPEQSGDAGMTLLANFAKL